MTELGRLLARSWFFADLIEKEIGALEAIAQLRAVRSRQHVVRKGEPGGPIFAVLRGRLKVSTSGSPRETTFRVLGPGDLFGEISAFDGAPRSANVTAIEVCQVAVLPKNEFVDFLDRHPAVSRKILAALARRVRELSERAEDRGALDVTARLAKSLLDLAARYGKKGPEGTVCDVKISQRELGELIDASRESVNKVLASWKASRLATHSPTRIVVHDVPALRAMADGGARAASR